MLDKRSECGVDPVGNAAELDRHEAQQLGDVVGARPAAVAGAGLHDARADGNAVDVGKHMVVGDDPAPAGAVVPAETAERAGVGNGHRRDARTEPQGVVALARPQRALSADIDDLGLAAGDVEDTLDQRALQRAPALHQHGELRLLPLRRFGHAERNILDGAPPRPPRPQRFSLEQLRVDEQARRRCFRTAGLGQLDELENPGEDLGLQAERRIAAHRILQSRI